MVGWVAGWLGGWLENLILMKTQSSAQTWTWTLDFDLGFVKMKSTLRKQGLIVNEEVKGVEIESNEQKPAEPRVKFYGKEALPAV